MNIKHVHNAYVKLLSKSQNRSTFYAAGDQYQRRCGSSHVFLIQYHCDENKKEKS